MESDNVFRDMGKYAENKVKKRVKDRLGRDPDTSPSPVPTVRESNPLPIRSPSNSQSGESTADCLPQQVGTNWEDIAIPRFFSDVGYFAILACFGNLQLVSTQEICFAIQESLLRP